MPHASHAAGPVEERHTRLRAVRHVVMVVIIINDHVPGLRIDIYCAMLFAVVLECTLSV